MKTGHYAKCKSGNLGFSLIELLVAMVLSLFLVGGVILMYLSTRATYLDSNQLSRLQENTRFASDYLVRDIRNAGFRDELSLTLGEEELIARQFADLNADGDQLTIRYAGRGHCQEEFDDYQVVQNRYWFDAATGELRCAGSTAPDFTEANTGTALVGGLTGLNYQMVMADGSTVSADQSCDGWSPGLALSQKCLAVKVGLEFEGLMDTGEGQAEQRFVELWATFRNAAITHVYGNLYEDES